MRSSAGLRLILAATLALSCDGDVATSTTAAAVTEEAPSEQGVITDPVPPEGFTGDPSEMVPVSPEEAAALAAAAALNAARNPPGQDPVDRGFATMRPSVDAVLIVEPLP